MNNHNNNHNNHNINSALFNLYSGNKSIIQYKQFLSIKKDVNYIQYKQLYEDDNSIYIEIPKIQEITMISNINIDSKNKNAGYEFIIDKNIIKKESILIKDYKNFKNIFLRIYNITNYSEFLVSFDVTLTKKSIRSSL